jgi:SAM-dependent methyltransferase
MRVIDPAGFETLFRKDADPWNYATSPFEAYKRGVLLRACGPRMRGRGLELACANGETTRHLARRCLDLIALDVSPSAVKEARKRLKGYRNIHLREALLPRDMPRGQFDLIVVSELLYYLRTRDADCLVARLTGSVSRGGRIVLLHHHVDFDDAAQKPDLAQKRAALRLSATMGQSFHYRDSRFDCLAFDAPRT